MIKHLSITDDFSAIPYLRTSVLMQNHSEGITFSTDKPNVIVGENGSGKSAVLNALALRTLSYSLGQSTFDNYFFSSSQSRGWWTEGRSYWSRDYHFLKGLICDTDNAPAMYYRPGHVPGNEKWAGAAMMSYGEKAQEYREKTMLRSAGQQCQSLLEKVMALLDGSGPDLEYEYFHWGYGRNARKVDYDGTEYDHKAEILRKLVAEVAPNAVPVLLGDEPEQSLDTKAELELWKKIEQVDPTRLQTIIATHSIYPILHPERFHLIEASPGYIESVRALL